MCSLSLIAIIKSDIDKEFVWDMISDFTSDFHRGVDLGFLIFGYSNILNIS